MFNWLLSLFKRTTAVVQPKKLDNPLAGKRLKYLIGTDSPPHLSDYIVEVGYDTERPTSPLCIAYCNLFDEKNTGKLGPYLHNSGTAREYDEGQIDPSGTGWEKNIQDQLRRRKKAGFEYIEWDNPDAYNWEEYRTAIDAAATAGIKVIAKNPDICDEPVAYVAHPNVYGIIVERGAGDPDEMNDLRQQASKPDLPVWFVFFGKGRGEAEFTAKLIKNKGYKNMYVSYSPVGEYASSEDIG